MPRPLRLLSLATLFPRADAPNFGVFVERQLAALNAREGVEVSVIAPVGLPPWPLSLAPAFKERRSLPREEMWNGLMVHRPRFTSWPGLPARNPGAVARAALPLAKRLHAERPFDVVGAEFFHPDGAAAQRIAGAIGLPYTIKARGADIHHWGQVPKVRRPMLAAADGAAQLLAVSEALAQDMTALGIDRGKVAVHYTGCDQERFRPVANRAAARAELGLTGPLIVSVGALIPRKRHRLLVEALPLLPEVTLAIAGAGPERDPLLHRAAELGMTERLHLLGSVPHDRLPQLLAAADLMALVSGSEGLANAWVEALACGTPILVADAGGARELLSDPAAGRIVSPEPQPIADAARAVLAAPPDPDRVRASVAHFTWERNAEELEALLRRAVR